MKVKITAKDSKNDKSAEALQMVWNELLADPGVRSGLMQTAITGDIKPLEMAIKRIKDKPDAQKDFRKERNVEAYDMDKAIAEVKALRERQEQELEEQQRKCNDKFIEALRDIENAVETIKRLSDITF